MNDKNLYKNIGINILMKPISMILSFLYIPLALSYLGDERYGVWATISSFVTWLSICDIGIGNGMRNKLAESYAHQNAEESKRIVSTSYFTITVIAFLVLVVFSCISFLFDIPTLLNITIFGENVALSIYITVLFVCLNFILSLGNVITYSIQKPAIAAICGVLVNLLNIIFVVFLKFFFPANMVIVAITLGSSGAIVNLFLNLYIFKKYVFLSPSLKCYDKKLVKTIATLGGLFFFGQIAALVMNSTDNILISMLFGAIDVTPYSTAYKLFTVFIHLQGVIIMPMWSAFTNAKAKKEYLWILEKCRKMQLLTFGLALCVVVLFFTINPISRLWLRKDMNYDALMLIIMTIYFVVYLFFNNFASILCGLGDVKLYSLFAVLSSIANIPLSVIFAKKCNLGLAGIMLGTLVSQLPYTVVLALRTGKHLKFFREHSCDESL